MKHLLRIFFIFAFINIFPTQLFAQAADSALEKVEISPEFPGLTIKYLSEHIEYSQFAQDNNIEGKVLLRFVVDTNGTITKARIIRSVYSRLDTAALNCVYGMPKWKPGVHHGRVVNVWFTQPINFRTEYSKSKSGNIELDWAGAYFSGPRSAFFSRFPEFKGNVDQDFAQVNKSSACKNCTVKVLATIKASGDISNIRTLSRKSKVSIEEVTEVINKTSYTNEKHSRWTPAEHDGERVDCDVVLTVNFKRR